jgi:hypothetical protein
MLCSTKHTIHDRVHKAITSRARPHVPERMPFICCRHPDGGFTDLSGSEIAGLKLNADWVILSACNTAPGAGEGEAAEALSGLARVFFYAGARALLVSHWEVDSDAAVRLVTGAVGALARDKRLCTRVGRVGQRYPAYTG